MSIMNLRAWLPSLRNALQDAADRYHAERLEQGCESCGGEVACTSCYRCSSWNCNGGCIFCAGRRPPRWEMK